MALDTSSRTSVALARVLLRERLGRDPEYVDQPPDVPSHAGGGGRRPRHRRSRAVLRRRRGAAGPRRGVDGAHRACPSSSPSGPGRPGVVDAGATSRACRPRCAPGSARLAADRGVVQWPRRGPRGPERSVPAREHRRTRWGRPSWRVCASSTGAPTPLGLIPRRAGAEVPWPIPETIDAQGRWRASGSPARRASPSCATATCSSWARWPTPCASGCIPKGVVTYIIDRNINYTNVCTAQCAFCAFYRDLPSKEGYLLTKAQLAQKIEETIALGGTDRGYPTRAASAPVSRSTRRPARSRAIPADRDIR